MGIAVRFCRNQISAGPMHPSGRGQKAGSFSRRNDDMENLLTGNAVQKSLEVLIPLGVFLVILLAGYLLRRYLFSRINRWAAKMGSRMGDAILSAIRSPFLVLCVMLGIYAALGVSDLPRTWVDKAEKVLAILAIVAVSIAAANLLCGFTRIRAERRGS
jgi:hypothetical protein